MSTFCLCLVAFFTACLFTYFNILKNTRFSNYFFLIYGSSVIIVYSIIYGIIGVGLFLLLKEKTILIQQNNTTLTGAYFSAFLVGLATKGIADIKFVEITHGSESFPIGLKSISQFIDKRFEKELDSLCFDRILTFMAPYRNRYKNTYTASFKSQVLEVFNSYPSSDRVIKFSDFVKNDSTSLRDILNEILNQFGKRTLNTICKNVNPDL